MYSKIALGYKTEQTTDTHNNVVKPQNHAEQTREKQQTALSAMLFIWAQEQAEYITGTEIRKWLF